MTTEVTKLNANQTAAAAAADAALAILDEAWAYYTPEEVVVSPNADEANEDAFVFYYDAA